MKDRSVETLINDLNNVAGVAYDLEIVQTPFTKDDLKKTNIIVLDLTGRTVKSSTDTGAQYLLQYDMWILSRQAKPVLADGELSKTDDAFTVMLNLERLIRAKLQYIYKFEGSEYGTISVNSNEYGCAQMKLGLQETLNPSYTEPQRG